MTKVNFFRRLAAVVQSQESDSLGDGLRWSVAFAKAARRFVSTLENDFCRLSKAMSIYYFPSPHPAGIYR
jgi:hypothetical protein